MKFGLQHPIFSFDYRKGDTSQIIDYLKNLIIKAENTGFDSFWTMDHSHQIPMVGKPEEPMLESWTTISVLASITTKSEEVARKRAQQFYIGIPEQQIRDREFAIYGTAEDVSRQIELLEEAGIQYLMVHLELSRELEACDTFANNILKKAA